MGPATVDGRPWDEFMAERPLGVLSTVSADGMPHAVPVEVVVRDRKVYAWAHSASAKVRNAEAQGRAAMVAYKGHVGVLVRGRVRLLHPGDAGYSEIAAAFLAKYQREETYGNDTLVEISPDRVSAFS
jgi:nitroimidazol reductase NimA-like FMN-containing flavoprotein (pyridoxamine 5'-phosphate oxidase superfamily)